MSFHQLKIVIWKNFIIRKRHWFLTIIEAILPICLFLIIAYGRSKITGLTKEEITDPTFNEIEGIPNQISIANTYILYTPNNDYFTNIISKMHAKLEMPSDQVVRFGSENELLEFYTRNPNYTTIGIIFEQGDPKKLNYKIRYNEPHVYHRFLSTNERYENPYIFEPGTGGVYKYQAFVPIQLALDMAFLEYNLNVENLENNITISIQEFPYPPHKKDSAITTIFLNCLPLITLFSFIFLCPAVLKRVVEEKHSGTKELLKMVGMKSWMLWLGWYIHGIQPMILAIVGIVILMKVPFFGSDYPLIEYTNWGILFVFLILYCTAAIAFCFAISSFFRKPTVALVTGILVWTLSHFVPKYAFQLDESNNLSWLENILLNLLPNMSLHYGYSAIHVLEEREVGINWNNFYKSSSGGEDDVTMLNVYMVLIFDTVFYTLFTIYMDGVNPGKYGVKRSFFFPITDFVKFITKSTPGKVKPDFETVRLENVEDGFNKEKSIEINHLHKRFGPKVAVEDLNLDIYKNQITVLLGHNGAGKSTTMSMITGMIQSTAGYIKINGLDINHNIDEIRQSLGLCPQHNLLFTDLTVKEHLLFFAKLKGKNDSEATEEAEKLMTTLNILDKKDSLPHTLSGGMQRKLCLGMAVIGGSKVLILDEPSSGMDPDSRRHLWDLLLQWRGERTILISTHFMEEADALGDWIAIMSHGTLKCYGTPMYLKKHYDTGYHLSLIIDDGFDVKNTISNIESEITKYIPKLQLTSSNGNNIIFVLPSGNNTEMTHLLEALERKKRELHIESISVTITTLEDVFLRTREETKTSSCSNSSELKENPISDNNIMNRSIEALIYKKIQFFIKKLLAYVVPIIIGFIFFLLTAYLSSRGGSFSNKEPELKLRLSSYRQTSVYYNGTDGNSEVNKILEYYKQAIENEKSVSFEVSDVEKAILQKSMENIAYYREHMVAGANIRSDNFSTTLIGLYNAMALHSVPISLNLLTDSLAKSLLGPEYSISISNWPLPSENLSPQEFSEAKVAILWLVMLPVGCLFVLGSFIIFPQTEISTKFIRLQYMCGVKPIVYWLVNFFTDMSFYLILTLVMTLLVWLISPMLTHSFVEFGYLFLIFFLYGVAGIPFAYIFSRKASIAGAFALFFIMCMFLGIILTLVIRVLLESQDEYYINIGNNLRHFCFLLIPQVGLSDALVIFVRRAVTINNYESAPKKLGAICSYRSHACCIESSTECAMFKSYTNLFNEHLLMLGSGVIYLVINIMMDTYWVKKVWSKFWYKIYSIMPSKNTENDKVSKRDGLSNTDEKILEANHLTKQYSRKQIIKNITLSLKHGQCLGILGVNGAGKTTTFNLLTREEVVDGGSVQIVGKGNDIIDIKDDKYMKSLGYCPQTDNLNYVLTGRQILTTIAKLRDEDPKIVDSFLEMFDLTEYADVPCGHYSGGNKRKLSLAVSLIGFRPFILLDEPTNGVDPSSRRKTWELIKNMQQKKEVSFILTSHSMMECEALCNELKIMKEGKFVVEGNLAKLKEEHNGFFLKIKLSIKNKVKEINDDVDEVDGCPSLPQYQFNSIEEIKNHLMQNGGELKDEHSGLLNFYIKREQKNWSEIFKEVEDLKSRNPHLIEDYAISQASLEDIFLKVARTDEKT